MSAIHGSPVALFLIALIAGNSAQAQGSGAVQSPTRPSAPATVARPALPPIGIIDFYGLHQLSVNTLRNVLTIKVGDSITPGDRSFFDASKQRLMMMPGVSSARVNVVCCADGRSIVFVGIEEANSPTIHFRPAPTGAIRLPPDAIQAGAEFDQLVMKAVLTGHASEDDSEGHMLLRDVAEARPVEDHLVAIARINLPLLRQVLHDSADSDHRALAAEFLGYASDLQSVVPDLVYAMNDASDGVRNNAMRALGVFAMATKVRAPHVPYEPFVALLNSPIWTDRNKASFSLMSMVRMRDPALFKLLHERALPALVEMARWSSRDHAFAAFAILGEVGGIADQDIFSAWQRNDRESVIQRALRQ